jgi:hypothetical protein
MSPKGVLLNFKEVLLQGFTRVFPEAAVYHNFFHFVQANVKHITELGFKSRTKELVVNINTLWYTSMKQQFNK